MKILGTRDDEPLKELKLRLKSTDRKFVCQWRVLPHFDSMDVEPGRGGRATITFADSHEIDELIHMLEKFKQNNIDYSIGRWE